MKYYKEMKIVTLEDCELPYDMRGEVYTIIELIEDGVLKVKDSNSKVMLIGSGFLDNKATKKLNQTKSDFNKKLKFDEIDVELQFNQACENDTDIFINIVDSKSEIFTTLSPKQTKKLIKHLQKMVDYVEE